MFARKDDIIGIIAPANIKFCPFIQYYLKVLKDNGNQYHIMSWDRKKIDEQNANYVFHYPVNDSERAKVFLGHAIFAHKCRAYIKRNHVTKLIILTAAPTFFLGPAFLRKFSGRYILDIRDDSPLVRKFPKAFANICSMAKQVITSSPKFNEWIPTETLLCHNADVDQVKTRLTLPAKQEYVQPISIVFAGMLNEGKINLEMLKYIGKDSRFRFSYIGSDCKGKETISQFVQQEGLDNVDFQGTYNKDDIYDIYREKADLVNIIRVKSTINRNALPNKLYDAVLAGVPVVVFEHNDAIADYVKEYNLGIVLEDKMEAIGDAIAQAMKQFNYSNYAMGRQAFLNKVLMDMVRFQQSVERFGSR